MKIQIDLNDNIIAELAGALGAEASVDSLTLRVEEILFGALEAKRRSCYLEPPLVVLARAEVFSGEAEG